MWHSGIRAARAVLFSWACLSLAASAAAQETRLPTLDEVKALKAIYEAERDHVVKDGIGTRFLPILTIKAEEMAKKADKALGSGRLLQATELFRQARWQLPYQSKTVPVKHVVRILGNLRLRHGQEVNALSFSTDGKLLATASRDLTVKVWDLSNGHELLTYTGHADNVRSVAFSPDGKTIASAGSERDIRLWEARTGKDIRVLKGQGEYVTGLVFSRDSKHVIASQAGDRAKMMPGFLVVYDVASGDVKRSVSDFRGRAEHVAVNQDGAVIAAGDAEGALRLWHYPKMADEPLTPDYWSQQDLNGATHFIAFSPDNRTVARIGQDGIKLYNLVLPGTAFGIMPPRKHILALPAPHRYLCAVFSKDGRSLFAGATDGVIRVFDGESGEQTATFKGHNGDIRSLAFNPTGTQLASASADYTVRLWDFDIVLQSRDHTGHDGPVWTAFFSPDGDTIVTASADKTARVIQAGTGEVLFHLKGHASPVTYALFSPDGKFIATGSGDKLIKLWDAAKGTHLRDLEGHTGTILSLDFSADGKRLLSGAADKTIRVWDVDSGKTTLTISDNKSVPAGVAFSPKGDQIAAGNVDQTIKLYDAAGKLQHSWSAHAIAVTGIAYSPNGLLLASCGADTMVRVWSLAKPGDSPLVLSGHTGPLSSVAFRNDSQHLVSAGSDAMVKLWKLEGTAYKEAQTFRGHKDWVANVAFSKDGYYVVSAGVDKLVKVWEITSREIPFLTEHTGSVDAVAVSPDGKLIATGASDRTIKIWDREKGVELHTLRGHTEGILALAFLADNKTLISAGVDRNIRLWDATSGTAMTLLPGQQHAFIGHIAPPPYLVAPSVGANLFAWIPEERHSTLLGWEVATGNELFRLVDRRSIAAAAFSADGKLAATAGRDGGIRLYELKGDKSAQLGAELFPAAKGVSIGDIAFSPDGSFLMVTTEKGEVKLLDAAKREVTKTINAHPGRISICFVSPDGKRLVTVGLENTIKLWDAASGAELRTWDLRGSERGAFVHSLCYAPDGRSLVAGNANTTVFVLELP